MTSLIIILVSLIFSAFFSGMEIAYVSSNKLRLELDKKQEKSISKIITIFSQNPSRYISTMLIGNNIALVIYGIFMAILLEPLIEKITSSDILILATQTILSTIIILITAEFLPKTLFRINPNFSLNFFAIPVMIFYVLFYPISSFTIFLSNSMLKKILNVKINKKNPPKVFGKVDLDDFVSNISTSPLDEDEIEPDIKIFQNALDFSNVKLRECIVPRTDITALEINDTIENLKHKFIETGFSKILIYKESIDNIIGYVHSSELFKNPKTIKSMLRHIIIVPETMPANKLLSDFITQNKSIAVVVDEFGGTSGMVTIEDIIEEITGEIEDEHDIVELTEKQINENEYILSGKIEIDYLNEKYHLNIIESDEYETIAGYILYHYENIPILNEIIEIRERTVFSFKILEVSKTRIELVRLTIKEDDS